MNVTTKIPPQGIETVFASQRTTALHWRSSTAAERIARLKGLEAALLAHRTQLHAALHEDLRKPAAETDLAEIMPVIAEIRHACRHLRGWMRPRRVTPTKTMLGTQARIIPQPKGVSLIISPWNYPVSLTLGPLVSALAAGCPVMIKPSELSLCSAAVMGKLLGSLFPPSEVAFFEGDASLSTALLALPFDHVFFTGAPAIGKIVMAAAAKHLSSVTLELGGKSPVIVDASADIAKAAASICWGKFLNAGQTCVAPDYLFVHDSVLPQFLDAAKTAITRMFGDTPRQSPDYGRIINARHFARVARLLDDAVNHGARTITGGTVDASDQFIAPTLLTDMRPDAAVMHEEIFGPVLPILPFRDLGSTIAFINAREKPLALYVYARDQAVIDEVLRETSSGGACVNMSVLQFSHSNLPFGGVNNSGIGASHGIFGFQAFSHERAVLRDRFSVTPMLFPPYSRRVRKMIDFTMRYFM